MSTKKLTHPTSGQTVEVEVDHADTYASQGWVEVKAEKKPAKKSTED